MKLATIGREIHPGYALEIWHNPRETFEPAFNTGTRFRLVFIEGGTGILRLKERRVAFIAPILFCLNEQDQPKLEQRLNLRAQALYFHPDVINGDFTLEIAHGEGQGLPKTTDLQDLFYLQPFVQRSPEYSGELRIGPASAQRLSHLFEATSQEIALQRDTVWPCRSRSFLLELLFLVERLFSEPQETDGSVLTAASDDVADIIMYLHAHYDKRITIEELTRTFHVNRTTLTERFREATGMPVITYLIQLRVRMAAMLLRDTKLSIAEILHRVGFNDPTHFGRTFRKYLGYSPSEYRESFCWMLP
jgi:AraC-like DNA-binding protein